MKNKLPTGKASYKRITILIFIFSCHKSIESLCVFAQSKAGFWKKNGQSHQSTMFYYSDQRCKRLLFNMDLQAAQVRSQNIIASSLFSSS